MTDFLDRVDKVYRHSIEDDRLANALQRVAELRAEIEILNNKLDAALDDGADARAALLALVRIELSRGGFTFPDEQQALRQARVVLADYGVDPLGHVSEARVREFEEWGKRGGGEP